MKALFVAALAFAAVACGSSSSNGTSDQNVVAAAPMPAVGSYGLSERSNLKGTLEVKSVSGDQFAFSISNSAEVAGDEDPAQAGTHEYSVEGLAKVIDGGFIYLDRGCELDFTYDAAMKSLKVAQNEQTICSRDPFVSFDGSYTIK